VRVYSNPSSILAIRQKSRDTYRIEIGFYDLFRVNRFEKVVRDFGIRRLHPQLLSEPESIAVYFFGGPFVEAPRVQCNAALRYRFMNQAWKTYIIF